MKKIYFILLLLLTATVAYSQQASYYFKNYQVQNGLSSNTITSILQDKKGFMWFGSRNGLNRFDGNVFKLFGNKLGDSTSIGSNSIFSLYEDSRETIWVGTYKGIYLFNPLKESFTAFKLIAPGEVRYITGDKQHHIWIISDLNLYRYDELTNTVSTYPLGTDQTITMNMAADGSLWTATSKGFINHYNTAGKKLAGYELATANGGHKFSAIQEIYPVGDTSVIAGTMNQAVLYNYKNKRLLNILQDQKTSADVHVHVIFHQNDGNYWFGTENGLYIYTLQTSKTTIVQKQYSNPYAITDNIISAIYQDREGGTWIGTYFGGLNYYSGQYNNFKKYFPEPGINSLSGNIVHEITKDRFGNLWVGTEDAGLNKVDLKTGFVKHFLPGKEPGSIAYRNIHGLVADGNMLWIGTYEHGLDVMDLRTEKVVKHYTSGLGGRSFSSNFIVSLYKTHQGDILVGTWNGLFKYNPQSDDFSAIPFFTGHIQSIKEDRQGTLWVSTYGTGVYYLNEAKNSKGHIYYQAGKVNSILNDYVNGLFIDKRYNMWFCTEGGLSSYNPQTRQVSNYTTENGLPDNQVFRVQEDESGKLWISTAKGLGRFDPTNNTFSNYHTVNGLPTEQFNYNSSYRDADGTMYYGTVKGMVSFMPTKFVRNPYVPPVYITGLQVNNQEITAGIKGSALQNSITYSPQITLPYSSSNISMDVAALSYVIPEMNGFAYKMDGIDKNWINFKNNRKIYYTKLPAGDYVFNLKGSNSEGVWNNKVVKLSVHILPPFYATLWAYALYLIIVAGVIITIVRYYHLAVSEKNKRRIETIEINTEREIYNAKIEFFTNVAHEIRTPLTLIKMPLDKLINREFDDPETIENLAMIKKNTNRLIGLTNQLLDFRKAEANKFSLNFSKTDINELLNEVYATFKPAAELKTLTYKLQLPRITLHAYVDHEALKKILSNLFNNAIKYAAQTAVIKLLPFSSEDEMFRVEIRNDGFLIPAELQDKIFEPFYRIKETEKEAGTGIGLPLAKSLTLLHKGTLELKPSINAQNIFLLSLPMHQETEIDLGGKEEPLIKEPEVPESTDTDKSKPYILLVEDNKEILNYLTRELTSTYYVLKASNGLEALDVLQRENVQIVISDIMMPVMDGIELVKKMKTDVQHSHIPIILLTAKNSLNSKIEGLEVGADAYIEKPFAFEHLLAQLNNLLVNRNMMKEYFARSPLTHIKGIAVSKADKDFLDRLNKVIYDHITDMELDVDQLSGMMNMSRPTLYRKIKGISDMTPNELINLSRLKKGAELLAEGDRKINEVANMIGYTLPTNFSRDFQRQFGVSPSIYVYNLKGDQKQV
ncbi:hybrid sensor histidine kinase/response regulator transcription factor [Mucilaginibacter pineti]|uniref:hybrid sensor histidine kinase/response regulator transcription factor n=1 Tax=Mucilaginibacter pineti TaxID=1391627 RepID=UPI001F078AEB|nr:hybrid sensor histidine kinase/response regulator transcription factor [Mucilaginibacter pineti]